MLLRDMHVLSLWDTRWGKYMFMRRIYKGDDDDIDVDDDNDDNYDDDNNNNNNNNNNNK